VSRYFPVDGRALRVSLGTRPLDLSDWIEIDDNRPTEMARKQELLASQHDEVVATIPRGDAAAQEVLDLLIEFLPKQFPNIYRYEPQSHRMFDLQREIDVDLTAAHPIDVAGQLVQEDLCVMSHVDNSWTLTAASLCFPSRWRLSDKIGRDLMHIHGPVPFYAERIGSATDSFFDRLTPDRPMWRLNWTVLDDAELFQPDSPRREHGPVVTSGSDLGATLFFRVERQTLRALPVTGDVLFTIRTYVEPLCELERLRPGSWKDLADTLDATPQPTIDYKGWAPLVAEMITWLREQPATTC
jgi:hypothetical protein